MLYGGRRLPLRAPRAKPAPNATQIAATTANPMYSAKSDPAKNMKIKTEYEQKKVDVS